MNRSGGRTRGRLSRTLSRARWSEYRALLEAARREDYSIISLEEWLAAPEGTAGRQLVLRHDVDQAPGSALAVAEIENDLGLRSTWYFRWRTAHPAVIGALRRGGCAVGLHYESLSREALRRGVHDPEGIERLIDSARELLKREITVFAAAHGPIRSVCPHGDSRIPHASNATLLRDQDPRDYGVDFDGNEAMRGRPLAHWLTDRSAAEGGWKDGVDPHRLLAEGVSPILCLTHPNNWESGAGLWRDRVLSLTLPQLDGVGGGRPARPIRTGNDGPPIDA